MRKLIDVIMIVSVLGLTLFSIHSIAKHDTNKVKQGIIKTTQGVL